MNFTKLKDFLNPSECTNLVEVKIKIYLTINLIKNFMAITVASSVAYARILKNRLKPF